MQRAESRYKSNRRLSRYAEHLVLSLVILLIAFVPTIWFSQYRRASELQMWFFDIGQGDATFIQTPQGSQILIDGGPDDTVLQKLSSVMWPWDRTIDAIIITHPDADHITGLVSVLEQYRVKMIIETGARSDTSFMDALAARMVEEDSDHRFVRAGDRFTFDDLQLLVEGPMQTYEHQKPKDANNTSVVLLATYGETSVLLTGDAEIEQESQMLSTLTDVDVLKVGHHGSKSSSSMPFLEKIKPEIATISSGVRNRYGHPHPVILSRLAQVRATVYRTDQDGDILLTSSLGEPTVQPQPLPF